MKKVILSVATLLAISTGAIASTTNAVSSQYDADTDVAETITKHCIPVTKCK